MQMSFETGLNLLAALAGGGGGKNIKKHNQTKLNNQQISKKICSQKHKTKQPPLSPLLLLAKNPGP